MISRVRTANVLSAHETLLVRSGNKLATTTLCGGIVSTDEAYSLGNLLLTLRKKGDNSAQRASLREGNLLKVHIPPCPAHPHVLVGHVRTVCTRVGYTQGSIGRYIRVGYQAPAPTSLITVVNLRVDLGPGTRLIL